METQIKGPAFYSFQGHVSAHLEPQQEEPENTKWPWKALVQPRDVSSHRPLLYSKGALLQGAFHKLQAMTVVSGGCYGQGCSMEPWTGSWKGWMELSNQDYAEDHGDGWKRRKRIVKIHLRPMLSKLRFSEFLHRQFDANADQMLAFARSVL